MTPDNPEQLFREIHECATAQLHGCITPEQLARLEWLVLHHPEARRLYVLYMQETVAIDRWAARGLYRPIIRSTAGQRRPRWHARFARYAAVAAAIAVIVGLVSFALRPGPDRPLLTARLDAVWEQQGQRLHLAVGQALPAQRLRLASGVAAISFRDGTLMVVQGPAELEAEADGAVKLHEGQFVARITAPAAGFRASTVDADFVDRGTEFGLRVGRNQPTELHVFQGMVEAASAAAGKQQVKENAAVRVDAAKRSIQTIPLDTIGFLRHVPEPGLLGEYFDSTDLREPKTTRIDPLIDFSEPSWDLAPPGTSVTPDGQYSIRWSGFIKIDRPGDWQFTTLSNDGVRVWIGNRQIINHWKQHVDAEDRATLKLEAGWQPIRIDYYQLEKSMTLRLSFSGPGQPKIVVPTTHLSALHPQTGERAAPSSRE